MELDMNKVEGKGEVDVNAIHGKVDIRKMAEAVINKVEVHGTGIVGDLPNDKEKSKKED